MEALKKVKEKPHKFGALFPEKKLPCPKPQSNPTNPSRQTHSPLILQDAPFLQSALL